MPIASKTPSFWARLASPVTSAVAVRRARNDFEAEYGAIRSMRGWRPTYKASRDALKPLRTRLGRIQQDIQRDSERGNRREIDALSSARNKVAEISRSLDLLMAQETKWSAKAVAIEAEIDTAWQMSATIPGNEVAVAVDRRKHEIESLLRWIIDCDTAAKIEQGLLTASRSLQALQGIVQQAHEVRTGWPRLKELIGGFNDSDIQRDVAFQEAFNRLLGMSSQVELSLKLCKYDIGFRSLGQAFRLVDDLRSDLDRRSSLAREEIDLWLDDQEIAMRFDLRRFPAKLSNAEALQWLELRPEIGRIVDERASKAWKLYGALRSSDRFPSWKELDRWNILIAHCRSTWPS